MKVSKACKSCSREKDYDAVHQKYVCRPCKATYAREWRKKNPDKVKKLNIEQRDKRKEFIKEQKLIDPNRYKKKIEAKKYCDKHKQNHELSSDGGWICRECKRTYAENYRKDEIKYKLSKHKRRLKRFGLTEEKFKELFNKTNGKCFICNSFETKKVNEKIIEIAIDHCKKSESLGVMKVRGLLCHACNTSLGGFKDNITLLQNAIDYLKAHKHIE